MFNDEQCILLFTTDCTEPDSVENGQLTTNGTRAGDEGILTCDTGPHMDGVLLFTIFCQENGSWNRTVECPRKYKLLLRQTC